jgi:hypothetical protein
LPIRIGPGTQGAVWRLRPIVKMMLVAPLMHVMFLASKKKRWPATVCVKSLSRVSRTALK